MKGGLKATCRSGTNLFTILPMARLLMIAGLICLAGMVILSARPDPWVRANEKAALDAELLSGLIARPDRIGWRLTEDLSLSRALLWDVQMRQRYPVQDGLTPLMYEFTEDEIRILTARQAALTAPVWQEYDTTGDQLSYCQDAPALCLIYDRSALELQLDLRQGALLRRHPDWILRAVLGALASVFVTAGLWMARGSNWKGLDAQQQSSAFKLLPERHSAMRGDTEILLSARDLKLLMLLDARKGAAVTKDELYDSGWGREFMPNSRALDQHMINLRRKLDPEKSLPVLIETVHGVGYRLVQ